MADKRRELPAYIYINPADAQDALKYELKAHLINEVLARNGEEDRYEAYVNLLSKSRSHIMCVLN